MGDHEPDPFRDTFVAMTGARAVIAATQMGIVQALAEQPASARALAARLGLDATGCEALLAALQALGYLALEGDEAYTPTPAGMRLVAGTQDSLAHFVGAYSEQAWEMLGSLERLLREPDAAASHARPSDDPFWEGYIRGLHELGRVQCARSAALVPIEDPRTLLDVAGGHGGFAMAMCRRFPSLRATVLDLPASVAVGRRIVAEEGFSERVSFREGDALEMSLGEDLDVISIFNLLHHIAPPGVRELLVRAHRALRSRRRDRDRRDRAQGTARGADARRRYERARVLRLERHSQLLARGARPMDRAGRLCRAADARRRGLGAQAALHRTRVAS